MFVYTSRKTRPHYCHHSQKNNHCQVFIVNSFPLGQGATLFCRRAFRRRRNIVCAECLWVIVFTAWQQQSINRIHWLLIRHRAPSTDEDIILNEDHSIIFELNFHRNMASQMLCKMMCNQHAQGSVIWVVWDIKLPKAYALILFPRSWKFLLVPAESLGSDEVCARYWPPPGVL